MKEAAATSPFAALSHQEQKERWICWQCQRVAQAPREVPEKQESAPALPTIRLPQAPAPEQKPAQPVPPIRHSQYDAVVGRMRSAQKQATAYRSWP